MATTSILRNKYIHFTAILCSAAIYGYLAYFVDRNQTALLLSCYGFLFLLGLLTYQYSGFSLKQLIVVGVLFRLLFLWATPFLSQDFLGLFGMAIWFYKALILTVLHLTP